MDELGNEDELHASGVYVLSQLAEVFGGELGRKIIEVLGELGEATDTQISEYLGVPEGEVRKVIWILSSEGLIISRKSVSETGWITFYWVLPLDQVDGIILGLYRRIIERIEEKIEYESQNIFYWCGTKGHERYTFAEAADIMFRCEKCGKTLMPFDNTKIITALKWVLGKLKRIQHTYFDKEDLGGESEKK